ncbi:major facilitator superfamily domain-containing protein [Flagelloscypha sp. PMI_526]|nr:major facilitator superfamily domain-containing protein [Flagelloscypha sp. PMI_526]
MTDSSTDRDGASPAFVDEKATVTLLWHDDPRNPLNWSSKRKWTATAVVGIYSLVAPMSSVTMAPALEIIAAEYGETNATVIGLTLSIFLLLFAFGPLIWAPLSEMYGRTSSMHIANIGAAVFNLACAFSPTISVLIVMRLFTGFFASAAMTIGAGSISDLFAPKDRASAMAIYSLGPLLGPSVGPIIGGFVAQSLEIKWIFIIMAIITAAASAFGIPLLRETYAPVLQKRIAKEDGTLDQFLLDHPELATGGNWSAKAQLFWKNLQRPTVLFFQSLVLFMLASYMAFIFGLNYLMFSTFPLVYRERYGFNTGAIGLSYLGVGLGCVFAAAFGSRFGDQLYQYLGKRDGVNKPEHRIPALVIGSLFCPIGLFWYGWSAQAGTHWIMPIIGTGIFAFGMMTAWLPITLYVVDTFVFAASAASTLAVFRSLVAFAFPLFARQMFEALGLGPGNSLLAGLAIILGIPFPVWLYFNGERVRTRNKHSR